MKIRTLFNFLFLLLLPLLLNAQTEQGEGKEWSLRECLDYALQNNLDVQLSKLNIADNKALLEQANFARLPNLNGFASHSYNWGRSFDVYTNAPITQRVRSNNFGVSSNLTLFNGMQIHNTVKQSQQNYNASKADMEKAQNDLMLNVVSLYLQIMFDQENLDNSQRLLGNTESQIERTEKLVNGGVLAETNLLELLAQKATDEVQVVTNENALAFSILSLKQLLQIPYEEPFDIIIPEIADPESDLLIESASEIYNTAEATMPEVQSADLNIMSAETGVKIAQGAYYPTLTLQAGVNTFFSSAQAVQYSSEVIGYEETAIGYINIPADLSPDGVPIQYPVFSQYPQTQIIESDFLFWDQLEESLRKSIGFNLSIPIYNRHQVKTGVNRAKIQYQRAQVTSKQVKNQLRQTIETARQDVLAASKTFDANQRRLESLQETFRITESQFNIGAANQTDYNVARNNMINAQSDLVRTKYDYVFKMKVLDFYLGKTLEF
ncbi:TolC family protein [Chondrinema litorale]|uniref:TolC family protein n=1 Tax=Chondrinema litorale TaxID=2994555 RepID=UPI0025437AA0|nr:TolC family protein [Chondrinema litorale]UZR94580.1 TolC family protein [Chondrinema litorale]